MRIRRGAAPTLRLRRGFSRRIKWRGFTQTQGGGGEGQLIQFTNRQIGQIGDNLPVQLDWDFEHF